MVDVDCRCKIRNEAAFVTLMEFGRHRGVLESSLPVCLPWCWEGKAQNVNRWCVFAMALGQGVTWADRISRCQADHLAGAGKRAEGFDDALIADLKNQAQAVSGHGFRGLGKQFQNLAWKGVWFMGAIRRHGGSQLQIGSAGGFSQIESQWTKTGSGTMVDGESQLATAALKIEERIDPGIKIGRSAQAVSGSGGRGLFARVMDDQDRDTGLTLQGSQAAEQGGHLTGYILIRGVKTGQGIKDQQGRTTKPHRGCKPVLIAGAIQVEGIGGDDIDVELIGVALMGVGPRVQA